MNSFSAILVVMMFSVGDSAPVERHALFTDILREVVHDGKVRYAELKKESRLDDYIEQLQDTNPDSLTDRSEALAFWLNAYNAFTLKLIVDNYPVKSINDLHFGGLYVGTILKKTVWHNKFININGRQLSLNNIEHDIIRPQFKDPRVHFALVCASISCPPLRAEAFEGDKIESQLDDQGAKFFAESDKNRFEPQKRKAHLSRILDWYSGDFGKDKRDVLLYVTRFLPAQLAEDIRTHLGDWDISYTDYDWRLNE